MYFRRALLRAWRGLDEFEGRAGSLRTWLLQNRDQRVPRRGREAVQERGLPIELRAASRIPREEPGERLTESVWLEPYPDEKLGLEDGYAAPEARYERRESVELAFIAALQNLPPRQRAVLILREVLGFSAREVAETLETTVASVNSALSAPARRRRAPPRAEPADHTARAGRRAHPRARRGLRGRVGQGRRRHHGRDAHRAADVRNAAVRVVVPRAGGGRGLSARWPAAWAPGPGARQRAAGVRRISVESRGGKLPWCGARRAHPRWPRIAAVTAFGSPAVFGRFGLPDELAPGGDR